MTKERASEPLEIKDPYTLKEYSCCTCQQNQGYYSKNVKQKRDFKCLKCGKEIVF